MRSVEEAKLGGSLLDRPAAGTAHRDVLISGRLIIETIGYSALNNCEKEVVLPVAQAGYITRLDQDDAWEFD